MLPPSVSFLGAAFQPVMLGILMDGIITAEKYSTFLIHHPEPSGKQLIPSSLIFDNDPKQTVNAVNACLDRKNT